MRLPGNPEAEIRGLWCTGKHVPLVLPSSTASFPQRFIHAFLQVQRTITSSQAMSLLARTPRLTARSARSSMLVRSRSMHGECEIRVSHRSLHFHGGKLRKLSYNASHEFDYGKKVPSATKALPYPLVLSPVDIQTNEFVCSSNRVQFPRWVVRLWAVIRVLQKFSFSVNICKHLLLGLASIYSNSRLRPRRVYPCARRLLHFSVMLSDLERVGLPVHEWTPLSMS